jgi:hypothetical protein
VRCKIEPDPAHVLLDQLHVFHLPSVVVKDVVVKLIGFDYLFTLNPFIYEVDYVLRKAPFEFVQVLGVNKV